MPLKQNFRNCSKLKRVIYSDIETPESIRRRDPVAWGNPRLQVRSDILWGVTAGELGVQRVVRTVLTARRCVPPGQQPSLALTLLESGHTLATLKTRKVEPLLPPFGEPQPEGAVTAAGSITMARSSLGRCRVVYARSAHVERAFFVVVDLPRARRIGDGCTTALEEVK